MRILTSENHEAFEPINISFIPAAKKATEEYGNSFSLQCPRKKFHCASEGLHLMSLCVSLHPFLRYRKEFVLKKKYTKKCKPIYRARVNCTSDQKLAQRLIPSFLHHRDTLPNPCRMLAHLGNRDDSSE